MENGVATQNNLPATGIQGLSKFLNSDAIKKKFSEMLGENAPGFLSSLLSVINSNGQLANADQNSIYTSALLAASLKLPIIPSLGYAYIVAYNTKQADGSWKIMAQFQMGYKGFKQLAQRTGQFLFLNADDVREGEIKSRNRLTGEIEFDWIQDEKKRQKTPIIGYMSYFELVTGFKSTFYMTKEEIEAHGKKYSQTYKKNFGLWKEDFENMALKTVTKLNLSKNAPLSIDVNLQRSVVADQSVITKFDPSEEEPLEVEAIYVDNNATDEEKAEDKKASIKEGQKSGEQAKIDMP